MFGFHIGRNYSILSDSDLKQAYFDICHDLNNGDVPDNKQGALIELQREMNNRNIIIGHFFIEWLNKN